MPTRARSKTSQRPRARETIETRTPNVPSARRAVDAAKYRAMKAVLLEVLPRRGPGLTQTEMMEAVAARAPKAQFPDAGKSSWWAKCVQLDLEARGQVVRDHRARPLRWTRK
jgi:hypothetical protein